MKVWDLLKKGWVFYLCSAFVIVGMLVACFTDGTWYDEDYSLVLIKSSYIDLTLKTAADVHPPLYYWILKGFVDFFSLFHANKYVVAKIVSVLPYVLSTVFCATVVRKERGLLFSGMLALVLTLVPNTFYFSTEIRMYSFSYLFVFLAFYYAEHILVSGGTQKDWLILSLASLGAGYSHYFALMAVVFFWIFLLIFAIQRKEFLKRYLPYGGATILLYIPWLVAMLSQIRTFGMMPQLGNIVFSMFFETLQYGADFALFPVFLDWVVVALAFAVLVLYFVRNRMAQKGLPILLACIVFTLMALSEAVLPAIVSHFVVVRYTYPVLGMIWYAVLGAGDSFFEEKGIAKEGNKTFDLVTKVCSLALACLFLVGGVADIPLGIAKVYEEERAEIPFQEVFQVKEGDYFVTDGGLCTALHLFERYPSIPMAIYGQSVAIGLELMDGVTYCTDESVVTLAKTHRVWLVDGLDESFGSLIETLEKEGFAVKSFGYFETSSSPAVDDLHLYLVG